jgi:monofunctional biosynthetic peptidoglycan transglycosylase
MIQPQRQKAGDGPTPLHGTTPLPGQPPRRRRWLRVLFGVSLVATSLLAAAIALMIVTGPDVSVLARQNPTSTAFMDLYRRQSPAGPLAWTWTPLDRISPHLRQAVLIGEDHEFYHHGGIIWGEILTAMTDSLSLGEGPRGASTITQQTARNLYLSPERSLRRKLREAVLAKQLEESLDKKRIFEIYLNIAELGPGIYGAEAAAQHYFHKPAAELNEQEAAELAATLPDPKDSHPGSRDAAYLARVGLIRERMNIFKDLG